jgi:hypothetical protein
MELVQWGDSSSTLTSNDSNGMGGYSPSMSYSSIFIPKVCFDNAQTNANSDKLYCSGNSIIMVLSFVNMCIFILMLVFHIKVKRRTEDWRVLLLKVKTMILFLIVLLELSVFIRYTF